MSDACTHWLPRDNDLSNLVANGELSHTGFTYHRTWETGLGSEIRVTGFSPDFYFPWNSTAPNPLLSIAQKEPPGQPE